MLGAATYESTILRKLESVNTFVKNLAPIRVITTTTRKPKHTDTITPNPITNILLPSHSNSSGIMHTLNTPTPNSLGMMNESLLSGGSSYSTVQVSERTSGNGYSHPHPLLKLTHPIRLARSAQFLNNMSGGSGGSNEGHTPPKKRAKRQEAMLMRNSSNEDSDEPPKAPSLSDNKKINSSSSDGFPTPFPLGNNPSQISMNLSLFSDIADDLSDPNSASKIPANPPNFELQMSSNFAGPGSLNVGSFAQNHVSDFPKAEVAMRSRSSTSRHPLESVLQSSVQFIWAKKWCKQSTNPTSSCPVQCGFPAFNKGEF